MSIEQDPARLAEQRRRQQQAILQRQYAQYVPTDATILGVQDIPRARTTPTGLPPSEYEYQGGYTQIYYQPSVKQPQAIIGPPLTREELKSTSFIPTTSYEQTPTSNLLKKVMLTPEQFQQKYGLSTGLPTGTIIYGLKETAEGYEIEYLPPIKFRERTEQRGRWWAEFGKGQQELYAPSLISLKISKQPRLSETLASGSFEQGFITSGEMLAETFLPYPTPRPSYHKSLIDIEYWKQPPAFIAGSLTGEVAQSIVGGWVFAGPIEAGTELVKKGVSKVTPEFVKRGVYEAKEAVRFSNVAKTLSEWKLDIQYSEPYYTISHLPSKLKTAWLQRFPSEAMRMESEISWGAVQKPLMTGFERDIISTHVFRAGTYETFPGFEFWATWKEAPKYVGYPVLRSLAAAPYYAAKVGVEQSIWGPSQILFGSKEQIASFETWASSAEAHPYAGYPVLYRDVAGISFAEKPTAFQQIMKEIEKGKFFPMAGGLSYQQVPIFTKPYFEATQFTQQTFTETTGKTSVPYVPQFADFWKTPRSQLFPVVMPSVSPHIKTPTRLIPKPTEVFEREKQKYRPFEMVEIKPKQTQAIIPEMAQKAQTQQKLVPALKFEFPIPPSLKLDIPIPTPKPPSFKDFKGTIPVIPPLIPLGGGEGRGGGSKSLFGKWFRKQQLIKTPRQMLQTYFGGPRKRRKK